jgi:predicted enzyme related to lactoylglutathione lyase
MSATKFQGLRTAIYKVSDMDKAKEWYRQVLNLDPYFEEPFYIGFNIAGYELGLIPDDKPFEKRDGVHAYWGVPDVTEMFSALLEAGASILEEPTDVGGGIIVATVKDPWDNVFGIIHNPHFKLPR